MARRALAFVLYTGLGVGGGVGLAALERAGVIPPWVTPAVFVTVFVVAVGFVFYGVRGLTAKDVWAWDDPDDDP
jgi:hypothetical protein